MERFECRDCIDMSGFFVRNATVPEKLLLQAHYTKDFFITNQIQWKFSFPFIHIIMKSSVWNFAYESTAVVACAKNAVIWEQVIKLQ